MISPITRANPAIKLENKRTVLPDVAYGAAITKSATGTKITRLLEDRLQHNPALAADIIKILLGVLHPGLYTDIGLQTSLIPGKINDKRFNSKFWAEQREEQLKNTDQLNVIDCATGRFRAELALTATNHPDRIYDLQIIYTTKDQNCCMVLNEMLSALYITLGTGRDKANKRSTYGAVSGDGDKGGSYTFGVWSDALAHYGDIHKTNIFYTKAYQQQNQPASHKNYRTAIIPIGAAPGFMGLGYKERAKSDIVDYKAGFMHDQIHEMFFKKSGDEMKLLNNSILMDQNLSKQASSLGVKQK